MKRYPAVELAATQGRRIAAGAGLACAAAAIVWGVGTGSIAALVAGLLGSALAFVLLRLGAEVVEIVADTLLPK